MEAFGRSSNPGRPRSSRFHEQKNSGAHPQFPASTRRRHACPAAVSSVAEQLDVTFPS